MNYKRSRILSIFLLVAVIVLSVLTFTACTKYKANKVSGIDSNAKVEGNGTQVVRKGKYIYFANGFTDKLDTGVWGKVVKGGLYRAEVDKNGMLIKGTQKQLVSTIVWSGNSKNGMYIQDDWLYFASPNRDRDGNGTQSKTDLDFWRVKLDGSVLQKIYTADDRKAEFIVKKTHLVFVSKKNMYSVDLTTLPKKRNVTQIKASVKKKTKLLESDVVDHLWNDNSDYIYYMVRRSTDKEHANAIESITYKGTDHKVVVPKDAYLSEEEKKEKEKHKDKLFGFRLMYWKNEEGRDTIMYKKSYQNSIQKTTTIMCSNILLQNGGLDIKNEKQIFTSEVEPLNVYYLGYDKGALVYEHNKTYWYHDNKSKIFADKKIKVVKVDKTNVYYFRQDSNADLTALSYDQEKEEEGIFATEKLIMKGLNFRYNDVSSVIFGNTIYYYNSKDSDYLYCADMSKSDNKPEKVSVAENTKDNNKKK